jgi:hypothetical protein
MKTHFKNKLNTFKRKEILHSKNFENLSITIKKKINNQMSSKPPIYKVNEGIYNFETIPSI